MCILIVLTCASTCVHIAKVPIILKLDRQEYRDMHIEIYVEIPTPAFVHVYVYIYIYIYLYTLAHVEYFMRICTDGLH